MKNGKKDDRMLDIWERLEERYYNLVRYLSPKTSIYFLCILFFMYYFINYITYFNILNILFFP